MFWRSADDGEDLDGFPNEGVEITFFDLELDVEAHRDPMDETQPDPSVVESSAEEDFLGLSDLYWKSDSSLVCWNWVDWLNWMEFSEFKNRASTLFKLGMDPDAQEALKDATNLESKRNKK
ncbi:hypothetical protein AgCh_004329 [Apium graveolens]